MTPEAQHRRASSGIRDCSNAGSLRHARRVSEPCGAELDELHRLYDRGRFLTVWERLQGRTDPETWQGPRARLLAARVCRFLGANRRADRLMFRTWRRASADPLVSYHFGWLVAERRGPWHGLRWNRQIPRAAQLPADLYGDLLAQEGEFLSRLRDFRRADRLLTEAATLLPDDSWIWVCHAHHRERNDDVPGALAAVQTALEKNREYPHALIALGHLKQLQGDDETALVTLQRAAHDTENAAAAALLAVLLRELSRPAECEAALARHEQLTPLAEPELQEWRAGLRAELAYRRGDLDAAAEFARQAGKHPFYQTFAERLKIRDPAWRRVELPVGFVRQQHLTCVPATLTTLSRFWNQPADQLEVADAICYDGTPSHSERRWAEERGWLAREFTVTLAASRALLDRGVPFAFTTVYPGGAHEQSVVGYDDYRGTLLLRDPHQRSRSELLTDKGLEAYAASGPRGLALVPADRAELLAELDLPETVLYDRHHALLLALDRHDRAMAAQLLAQLGHLAPDHRMTWQARRALALYDANPAVHLAALEELLKQFPQEVNFQLSRLALLRDLAPQTERLARLREAARVKDADPLLWQELAFELAQDARESREAARWLDRAARLRPADGYAHRIRANLLWDQGHRDEALELYRLAACLDDRREPNAQAYFRAARALGRADEALAWLRERFDREGHRSNLPGRTLVWALNELGQGDEAAAVLNRTVELRPADSELRLFACEQCAQRNDLAAADQHLQAAKEPTAPAAWARAAAQMAFRRGDAATQLEHWRTVLAAEPLAMDAHSALARLLAETAGRAAALAHFATTLERFPCFLPLHQLRLDWLREEGWPAHEEGVRKLILLDPRNAWAHRELGNNLMEQRRLDEAETVLDHAAQIEPNAVGLHNMRGQLAQLRGDQAAAQAAFRQALAHSVDSVWTMRQLLEACTSAEQRRESIAFLQAELVRQVTVGEGLFEFARLARAYLTPAELHDLLKRAHAARPDLWQTWSVLALQHSAEGRHDEALQLVSAANARFPLLPRLWWDRAQIHRVRLEKAEGIAALEKVRELSPTWGEAMRSLADALVNANRLPEAVQVLTETSRRVPLDSWVRSHLASLLRKSGRAGEALEALRETVRLDPGQEWAWNALAEVGRELGQPQAARERAEEILRERPAEPRSWWLLARLLTEPEQRARRLELLRHALELNPQFVAVHSLLAHTHAAAGDWEAAFTACRPAVFGAGQPPELAATEATLRTARGHPEAGIAVLRKALEAVPSFEPGWRQLAHLLHQRGDDEGALAAAEQVTRLAPHDPAPLGYAGELKLRRNDLEGAAESFRRAFELDAEYTYAGRQLFLLQLRWREFDRAFETLQRLKPHLPEAETRELELALALDTNRTDDIPVIVRQLCYARGENSGAFVRAAERLASIRPLIMPLALAAAADPASNPAAGWLWADLAGRHHLWKASRQLVTLDSASAQGRGAWEHWLELAGDRVGEYFQAHRLFRGCLAFRCRRFLTRHQAVVARHTPLWGKAGYLLAQTGNWRAMARWMGDWRQRPDAQPWMLGNLAHALNETDNEPELRHLLEHVLTVPRDNATVRLEIWRAAFLLADGDAAPARTLLAQVAPDSLETNEATFLRSLAIWVRFTPDRRDETFSTDDRQQLAALAHVCRQQPLLRKLFLRLMHQLAARTTWRWTGWWTRWVLLGLKDRPISYVLLLALVFLALWGFVARY